MKRFELPVKNRGRVIWRPVTVDRVSPTRKGFCGAVAEDPIGRKDDKKERPTRSQR